MQVNIRIILSLLLLTSAVSLSGQSTAAPNLTDKQGKKQGHWIKKFPNEAIMYDGYFKDDHPVGEFKRYYEDQTLKSVLNYSNDGLKASVIIYHPNGNIAVKGNYINQLKEGKWQFFSAFITGYLISEDNYLKNLRNGLSVKFYTDSTIAEKVNFIKGKKQGEWTQYYPSGKLRLRSVFSNDLLNGKFETWHENGQIEFSGQYKDDYRDGLWTISKENGSVKYRLTYDNGVTHDRQMDIDESNFLDSLENNKGKIADPEKTGVLP